MTCFLSAIIFGAVFISRRIDRINLLNGYFFRQVDHFFQGITVKISKFFIFI